MMKMGAVHRPDIEKKKEEVLRDLSPEIRESVKKMIDQYKGEDLEDKLEQLIGIEKARKLVERR